MYCNLFCKGSILNSESEHYSFIGEEVLLLFSGNNRYEQNLCESFCIGGLSYQTNLLLLEIKDVVNHVRKIWLQIEEAALKDRICNFSAADIGQQVVNTTALLRLSVLTTCSVNQDRNVCGEVLEAANLLESTIKPWMNLEGQYLLKLASPSVLIKESPIHHYFHMYLNVRWLLLTIRWCCSISLNQREQYVKEFMSDLVLLSNTYFKKHKQDSILQVDSFICCCVKQIWILIQFFCENLHRNKYTDDVFIIKRTFWDLFAETLEDSEDMFALWLLNRVVELQVCILLK